MKQSIAISIESMGAGGAQMVVACLIEELVAAHYNVSLITFSEANTDFFKTPMNVDRQSIRQDTPSSSVTAAIFSNIKRLVRLRQAIKNAKCEFVISFVGSQNILTIIACLGLTTKVIISERNDPALQSLGKTWDALRRFFYPMAHLVTANSKNAIGHLSQFVPSNKLVFLENPIRKLPKPDAPPFKGDYFLAVGRHTPQKRYDLLIEAYAIASARFDLPALVLLGDGADRSILEAKAKDLNIHDQLYFKGIVSNVGDYYHHAIALIHPAQYEGTPNAVLEAMAASCPVVVSDSQASLREIIQHGVNGLIFSDGDAEMLAATIIQLAKDQEMQRRLSQGAFHTIDSRTRVQQPSEWLHLINTQEAFVVTTSKSSKGS